MGRLRFAAAADRDQAGERFPGQGRFEVRFARQALVARLISTELRQLFPAAQVIPVELEESVGEHDVTVEAAATGRRLVIFGRRPTAASVARELDEGTWSLVTVDGTPEEFASAARSLLGGPPFIAASITAAMARDFLGQTSVGQPENLTRRELGVLRLLGLGYSNAEIAKEMTVSPNTVRSHIRSVSSKLGAHTRHKAVIRAQEMGLI